MSVPRDTPPYLANIPSHSITPVPRPQKEEIPSNRQIEKLAREAAQEIYDNEYGKDRRHNVLDVSEWAIIIVDAIHTALGDMEKALKQEKLDRTNENGMLWSGINDLRLKRDVLERQFAIAQEALEWYAPGITNGQRARDALIKINSQNKGGSKPEKD